MQIYISVPLVITRVLIRVLCLYRRLRHGYVFMRIPLTKGKFAIVDVGDFAEINKHKWYTSQRGRFSYARRGDGIKHGNKTAIAMHREIMGHPKNMYIDHINHNGLDNRRANLRLATPKQNAWNNLPRKGNYSSKYKGVSWHKRDRKWYAKIVIHGKAKHLGGFNDEKAAAAAYNSAAKKLFGEFACLNKI